MTDTDYLKMKRRCPRLGSAVTFDYCLTGGEGDDPCRMVLDCWWEIFDVEAYLRRRLPEAQFEALLVRAATPPKNKVLSILEILEQAKNNES